MKTMTSTPSCDTNNSSNLLNNKCPRTIPHLILHFDINETILVGDEAGGDSVHECLNKIIAKSAFCMVPTTTPCSTSTENTESAQLNFSISETKKMKPSHWWDGTPLPNDKDNDDTTNETPPPLFTEWIWPPSTVPYYRTAYKRNAKCFTSHPHGRCYQSLYHQLERALELPKSVQGSKDEVGCDHPFHRMIPSFFHTLVELQKRKWSYTLVLRTFGSDLQDVVQAIQDFARGKHPLFPDFRDSTLAEWDTTKLYRGRWRMPQNGMKESSGNPVDQDFDAVYDLYPSHSHNDQNNPIATGDREVLSIIENCKVCGIQDDYAHWDKNNNAPWAGKPVWIRKKNKQNASSFCHQIFFDDNIHNDPTDSIVSVRLERSCDEDGIRKAEIGPFKSLSGVEIIEMQGKHLIRVPTICAIQERDWFIQRIESAISY